MQVRVKEDEVNVALQVLQAPQQQPLTLRLRLTTLDLRKEVNKFQPVQVQVDARHLYRVKYQKVRSVTLLNCDLFSVCNCHFACKAVCIMSGFLNI